MAFIDVKKIKKVEKERNLIHKEVDATFTSFINNDGNKYIQIDTYGSSERLNPGKISQSFQIDKESAEKLVEILKREFNL